MLTNSLQSKINHGAVKVPWLTILFTILMIGLYFLGQNPFDWMLFDKSLIVQGEYWRLLTCHFVHCNFQHLFWDLMAFIVLGVVIEYNSRKHFMPCLLSSCAVVSLWMFYIETQFQSYCGLSGALNGMLVLAAIMQYKSTEQKTYLCVLLATIAKIIFELTTHETIFTDLSVQAVPGSHAAGYIAGVFYMLMLRFQNKYLHFLNLKTNQ